MRTSRVLGAVFLSLGVFFLFYNVLHFSLSPVARFWPLALVLAGLLFVLRQRILGTVMIVFTVILLVSTVPSNLAQKHYSLELPRNSLESALLNLDFGAGELKIDAGSEGYLIRSEIDTSDTLAPTIRLEGNTILLERHGNGFGGNSVWNVLLSPDVIYDMELNVGAANSNLDFSGLKVRALKMNAGASKSTITLGTFPTSLNVESGASDLTLRLPKAYGAKIVVNAPLSSIDIDGFAKEGNEYKNQAYDRQQENIQVSIHAAASSVKILTY